MKNRELIEEKLFDDYLDKDVTVILRGCIITQFIIHNAKIFLNDNTLMITDTKVDNAITFELEEQKVTLDY